MRLALVAAFLFACVGGIFFFLDRTAPEAKRGIASTADALNVIDSFKQRITAALDNKGAINYTVAHNPNAFACMSGDTGDCTGKGGLILLYEGSLADGPALSQIHPGHGFAFDGLGCSNFPSHDCPIRIETDWKPVCGPLKCELTKSFRLHAKVTYQEELGTPPTEWSHEAMLTPEIKLSADVQCKREGGVYTGVACRRPGEVDNAHRGSLQNEGGGFVPPTPPEPGRQGNSAPETAQFACPDLITINGESYQVENAGLAMSEVTIPSTSGCNGQGFDTFKFQCIAKTPASFDGEGQWVQVSAILAPPCDESGRPMEGAAPSI